ncbi:PREDICTED: uncharacterized protein LOC104810516 [Tarenaya hassleriana]|uniref:uncharacterized protein LOC104810516 n=1 Tax=Tarenaya hassleriana TaxID=28532 RepID=UPI00053C1279|nr:PREDICTED: uncharacterized protein LOC104810516 [Tarenaya hassleriana]
MAPKSASSEEFSFPVLASDDTHPSCIDSPQLWKRSPPDAFLPDDYDRLLTRIPSNDDVQSRWSEGDEEKMDMLWQDLNDDLTRSRSLRIESDKKSSCSAAAVTVGCGIGRSMKVSKKTTTERKKPNVLVFMRVLKKLLLLRSSAHRSPAKTHPR